MEEKINILLIEDNKADAQLINFYLKESYSNYFSISITDYLAKGLDLLSKHVYDIIIIDLTLPDSMGIETFKEVHAAAAERPIIVLTGLEDESIGITTLKLGAQDFLVKGKLSSKSLRRSINYSIERYKLLQSLADHSKMLEEKTEDLLREKQKLAQAQKLAHVGSWEWTLKENTFSCSEELFRILQLEPPENGITYQEFQSFIHPDDRDHVNAEINLSIRKHQPFDFFYHIQRKDGSIRYLHAKGELVFDKDGTLLKIVGTEQDITRQKKEEQMEQLAMVVIKSYNAVTIADKEGRIEWVNEGFTKLFGYKLKDIKGTYGEVLRKGSNTGLSPENEFYKKIIKEKKPLSYENKNYSKTGEEYWVLTSLTPLLNEKGEIEKIISIDSDITKQKKAEQELIIANKIAEESLHQGKKALVELHKAKKDVEESLKVKEQFLANMSHEIRTPMNAIIGFTNLLLKTEPPAENKQYLKAIKTSGENLLVIINDILDFSKLESGKISIESIPFKVSQLISTVIDLMLPKAMEKKIKLSSSLDKNISEILLGDPTRLNQILINLVGNAIKFTDKGGIKILVEQLKETDEESELRFSVIDTGIGIAPESIDKIFEGFTQATNETTRKYGGTGLGLTITKELLELQGGSISVSSKVNEGSSFVFVMKFKKDPQINRIHNNEDDNLKNKFPLDQVTVLLVEDNLFNQMLASKILQNWHCHVEVADNGLMAIEKVKNHEYDLVLMDIQLPEMDGYEATAFIRNELPAPKNGIPIIAMTAHAFAEEVEKCRKIGMNDYISKPFDENKLYGKIVKALMEKSAPVPEEDPVTQPTQSLDKRLTDLSYLNKVSGSDGKFITKMISVFLDQTPVLLDTAKLHLDNRDWNSLKKVLHRMKPSIAFLKITELEEILSRIEKHIESGSAPDEVPPLLTETKNICSRVAVELKNEKEKLAGTHP